MTIKEYVGAEEDLRLIEQLLPQEFGDKTEVWSKWLRESRATLRGILIILEQVEQQTCIGVALGTSDYRGNLHLRDGIQICNREQLPMLELVTHLIEYARGKFTSICDACYPYAPGHTELLDTYRKLGFNIDRDPGFRVAAWARGQGIEKTPEESTPQPIRDTYFDLDL